ncbi:two-component system, NtrC family, response regulator [Abditibacterium utsteinense]|uniref:Two-component system, NtrC family, response regulator n=1 Tax=Abditibacterium utsteinense TaxID=1960156 RepID=A0A2S8SSM3_9BACT|nr:sigma-54 dependent transcriptional regulator [Abditibacterium utsteinense]PQV63813.1 two-component system, NtrC family, response regulator [Abditibacterium utsteinense]
MPQSVLVIDDEKKLAQLFAEILENEGLTVYTANKGGDGLAKLDELGDEIGMVFTDMKLPDMTGNDVLREVKKRRHDLPVVVVTGFATKDGAVEAMRLGAYDYLSKPFNIAEVSLIANRALERSRLIDENRYLQGELMTRYKFETIIGDSEAMQTAYVMAAKVAKQNVTVLITGESGTGKEVLARAIHYQSARGDKPFVKVNCAALPEHLLEDELFGHEKGAFTDASAQRIGRFEWAHQGTLFLDEIGEIAPSVQVKLLRVLQEREFERIGSSKTIKVDVRIIAATNRDLGRAILDGSFREDLFYRLNVVPIELPPLRDRPGDMPYLVNHFLKKYGEETGRIDMKVTGEAMESLKAHNWKGNIRELENCIERALILAEGDEIAPRHLLLGGNLNAGNSYMPGVAGATLQTVPELIQKALKRCDGNEKEAAKLLDCDVKTVRAFA